MMPVMPAVATVPLLLVHAPPGVPWLSIAVLPEHILLLPLMAPGTGCTVMALVTVQPDPKE